MALFWKCMAFTKLADLQVGYKEELKRGDASHTHNSFLRATYVCHLINQLASNPQEISGIREGTWQNIYDYRLAMVLIRSMSPFGQFAHSYTSTSPSDAYLFYCIRDAICPCRGQCFRCAET